MSTPTISENMIHLINKVMRSPDRAGLLDSVLECLADHFVVPREGTC